MKRSQNNSILIILIYKFKENIKVNITNIFLFIKKLYQIIL